MAFDPWSYEQPIGGGQCTINAVSYSQALADKDAGLITPEQVEQVVAIYGQTRACGGGVMPAGCAIPAAVFALALAAVVAACVLSGA